MAWLVFGLFFLHSDHAPWWLYALFVLGFIIDTLKERAAERREDAHRSVLLNTIEDLG